jgi:hypothetical protein
MTVPKLPFLIPVWFKHLDVYLVSPNVMQVVVNQLFPDVAPQLGNNFSHTLALALRLPFRLGSQILRSRTLALALHLPGRLGSQILRFARTHREGFIVLFVTVGAMAALQVVETHEHVSQLQVANDVLLAEASLLHVEIAGLNNMLSALKDTVSDDARIAGLQAKIIELVGKLAQRDATIVELQATMSEYDGLVVQLSIVFRVCFSGVVVVGGVNWVLNYFAPAVAVSVCVCSCGPISILNLVFEVLSDCTCIVPL